MPTIPRRNRLDLLTPTELKIRELIDEVESLGADLSLTEVVCSLGDAGNSLADWVDKESGILIGENNAE